MNGFVDTRMGAGRATTASASRDAVMMPRVTLRALALASMASLLAAIGSMWLSVPADASGEEPPTITGEWSADVTSTSALLRAHIDPRGSDTHFYFQYGGSDCATTPSACTELPAPPGADAGAGKTSQLVGVPVQSLTPSTTYYFRVIATNTLGTVEGKWLNLTTYPSREPFVLPDNRAYELVSPPEKEGADVGGNTLNGALASARAQSATSGEAITYMSSGSFGDARSAEIFTQYLSRREPSGWQTQNISPQGAVLSIAELRLFGFRRFSADLSAGVLDWETVPLTSGASPEYDNLYVYNTDDRAFQLLTPTAPPSVTRREYSLTVVGASSDFSHIVFEANDALTPGAPPKSSSVYEWRGGGLKLASVLPGPGEQPAPSASGGGSNLDNAVSADGSRIFWSAGGQLYMREDGTRTVKLNTSQRTTSLGDGWASFYGANVDGSRVFFTDGTALTDDPNDNGGLYEYNVESGTLTDLIPNAGGYPQISGVVAISNDGSFVYFVAKAALAGGASASTENLYVAHDKTLSFIARLTNEDSSDWNNEVSERTARTTPDGRHLVFMSEASLTGYDNTDAFTEKTDSEVFAYDADDGHLTCVSCNPSGERPIGPSSVSKGVDGTYLPRYISEDGTRIFFDSKDALLPTDTNDQQDVYEYENGQVHLISSGTSDDMSAFADASSNGNDAFFTTRSQLVSEDRDDNSDLYDARVDGGFQPAPTAPASCVGEACRGALSSPPVPVDIATANVEPSHEAVPSSPPAQTHTTKRKSRSATKHKPGKKHRKKQNKRSMHVRKSAHLAGARARGEGGQR